MLKINNPDVKNQLNHRLARIEGQLRGVQKMVDEERNCKDILQQLIAVRGALQSASLTFLQDVAQDCALNQEKLDNPQAQYEQMMALIQLLGKATQ
jgi:DNA-binding FrmR family transcriptional regulator